MELNWNFLGGGGCKTEKLLWGGGSMDIFWNCTLCCIDIRHWNKCDRIFFLSLGNK